MYAGRLTVLALTVLALGFLVLPRGESQERPATIAAKLEAAQRAAEQAVRSAGTEDEQAAALFALGRALFRQGRLAAAMRRYQDSLAIRRRQAEAAPGSAAAQLDMIVTLTGIGDVQRKLGDFDGALANYREQMAFVRALIETVGTPSVQADLKSLLATSFQQIGDALAGWDEVDDALRSYAGAVEVSRELVAGTPDSPEHRYQLAHGLTRLGDLQFRQGINVGVLSTFRESQGLLRQLAADDSVGAVASFREAGQILRRLAAENFNLPHVLRDLAVSLYKLGTITGDPHHYRQALDVVLSMEQRGILARGDAWWIADLRRLSAGYGKDICPGLAAVLRHSGTYFAEVAGDPLYPADDDLLPRKTTLEPSWTRACSVVREGALSEWGCDIFYETAAEGGYYFEKPGDHAFEELKGKVRACLGAGWDARESGPGSPVPSAMFTKGDRTIVITDYRERGHISVSRRMGGN